MSKINKSSAPRAKNKTASKAAGKKQAIKQVKGAKHAKSPSKDSCDKTKKPSLESILDEADHAFTDIVKKYLLLGEAYVKAITYYGSVGKKAFRTRFPLTDNALRNLEFVGRGRLLPQFAMCSDRFVNGLVNMVDSLTWQYKLLGASKNGMIRVKINGSLVDAKFEDLKSPKLVDGVLSVISDADKNLTPEQICEKLRNLKREVRSKFVREKRPLFDIHVVSGKKVVRFYRSTPLTAEDLQKIIERLEA